MKKPDWKLWIKDKSECKIWLDYYIKKQVLRKTTDEHKLYLKKADHNLIFANWIYEKHKDEIPNFFGKETFYDWIINIYYYAIYHSALSLLSKEGYKSNNHSATLCFLIYHHYHLQKAINKEDVKLIASSLTSEDIQTVGTSKKLREKARYDVHELFELSLAKNIKQDAINFINKIRVILRK